MSTSQRQQPVKPDAATKMKTYSDRQREHKITYKTTGNGNDETPPFTCIYKMGNEEIGNGDPMPNKDDAKQSAAEKALLTLDKRGLLKDARLSLRYVPRFQLHALPAETLVQVSLR
jgi:dsRNA-specific ribonuclease